MILFLLFPKEDQQMRLILVIFGAIVGREVFLYEIATVAYYSITILKRSEDL